MDTDEHLSAIVRDAAGFRAAVVTAGFDAPVPSCPDWTVADLVWHLTEVHHFWAFVVATQAEAPDAYVEPERVDGDALLARFDADLAVLLDALRAPAEAPVWTWSSDHTVGFIQRRMAHETAMHRWDAEAAAGRPADIDATLASDGIDEFVHHFLAGSASGSVGGSVHIHCGDVAGEWTVRPDQDGFHVTREHAKGDCALRGPASDLLLALWRRVGLEAVDVVGDTAVAQRFVAAAPLT